MWLKLIRWSLFAPPPCEFQGLRLRHEAEEEERCMAEKYQQLENLLLKGHSHTDPPPQRGFPTNTTAHSAAILDKDSNDQDALTEAFESQSGAANPSLSQAATKSIRSSLTFTLKSRTVTAVHPGGDLSLTRRPSSLTVRELALLSDIRSHQQRSDELNRLASYHIYKARNQYFDKETIDLSGLLTDDIRNKLLKRIRLCQRRGIERLAVILPHLSPEPSPRSRQSNNLPLRSTRSSLISEVTFIDTPSEFMLDAAAPSNIFAPCRMSSVSHHHGPNARPRSSLISPSVKPARVEEDRPRSAAVVRETVLFLLREHRLRYSLDSPQAGSIMVHIPSARERR
ncbi:hypothetical protein H4R33_004921 [Dimargaris cristalligena]|uniref:Uncharacterized protein n=1 Tax=Dimargaris cristalligena TaxID=215637 RepID=A0A4P9ZVD3_9FUNG|nr:hypothetical protein H4R33_004921 [Dimargaris cristalligena]RKP37238.1 hypothetical protein BJ085DRAFT_38807 [Dimargaris cristalligena]|eukprot:RKP37238.1 hypothetical protein BJ085DRAFT_38807 [Dimargaris cristalligena]